VSVALFGDGALEEGAWHEAANIAAMRRVPVIFLCENNSLEALGQKANEYPSSTLAAVELTDLVRPFGIPFEVVDGTDPGAVDGAMVRALERARTGGGPSFLETRTVRWPGNRPLWPQLLTGATDLAMAWDPSRIPDEHRAWHDHQDGVLRYVRELLAAGHVSRETVLEIDAAAVTEMADAVRFALDSPYPEPEEALDHVFA
jgi:acetoin:2,6-dichlorophenolindophenol oxidoreductase subunit alpha